MVSHLIGIEVGIDDGLVGLDLHHCVWAEGDEVLHLVARPGAVAFHHVLLQSILGRGVPIQERVEGLARFVLTPRTERLLRWDFQHGGDHTCRVFLNPSRDAAL